jgi:class 3 adenylate cyclase
LTSKAGAGEVWISEATAKALPNDMPSTALEPISVKGKAEPVKPSRAWPV